MNVVLSGIFYPMAMLRYFEAALKRRSDVNLFCVGPYTGTRIPWAGGMNLPTKYAIAPNLPIPIQAGVFQPTPIGFVESQLPWEADLWLQVDAGFYLLGKPARGENVIVATDPHVLNYDRQRTFADRFYCMQTPYQQEGDNYLPYAYDPVWHRPEEQARNYDACLIGLHYPNRNQLVGKLQAQGMKIYYDLGPCFDEARALYNQAPIGFNWSSLLDLTARVFELTAMGRLAVVNRVPDLERFFDEDELVIFETLEEAVDKTLYYWKNETEARDIARRGKKAVKPHTYDARIEELLQ